MPVADLFLSYWSTTLAESEIITDVLIPVARPRQGWSFHEMVRRTSDFAIVAVAAMVELGEEADTIAATRVALAGVADRALLAGPGLLGGLTGVNGSMLDGVAGAGGTGDGAGGAAGAAAAAIADSLEPVDDVHASADYRRRLVRVLVARALREAYADAARRVA
jgi:CO/xanthine dehydrogenase FAD-binding subunit